MIKSTCKICWKYERKSLNTQNKKKHLLIIATMYIYIITLLILYSTACTRLTSNCDTSVIALPTRPVKENKMNQRNFGSALISICDKGKNSFIDLLVFKITFLEQNFDIPEF